MMFIRRFTALYRQHWLMMSVTIAVILLRFLLLTFTPPGFYLDESAGAAQIVSLLSHGTNTHGQAWPLFTPALGAGFTTPIYLYPLTVWAMLFGTSEYSLRSFSLFATILAVLFISLAMRLWLNNKAAFIAALTALVLPWGWVQGSIAWDPALVPALVAAAFFGLTVAIKSSSKRHRLLAVAATGVSLVMLAYLYPPCRVTAPLLLALSYGILLYQRKLSAKTSLFIALGLGILCIPLLMFLLQPGALSRSAELSVFHNASIFGGIGRLVVNFTGLLNPFFLFITGDPNLRHSTGQQGMLGLSALPPILTLLYVGLYRLQQYRADKQWSWTSSPTTSLISIACAGIVFSLLGSALTTEGQPHSLRATAAWPFFVILITLGWTQLLSQLTSRRLQITAVTFAIIAAGYYVVDLSFYYPQRSATSFDVPVRQAIKHGQPTPEYPPLSLYYYTHK